MPGSPTELNALGAIRTGDTPASVGLSRIEQRVVRLFDEWRDPLLRYVLTFSLGVSDSEDIVQETFLALFQHLRAGKSRENIRAWLFRVAHNLALKKRQSARREAAQLSDSSLDVEAALIDPAPNAEDQAAANQRHSRVLAVVRALPEQSRWCLFLRAEGLRYREIAEILGVSAGSVSAYLARSLALIARAVNR